jgi:hypothetical protein
MVPKTVAQATPDKLRDVIALGLSPELFLSVYLPTVPAVNTEAARLRLAALLDEAGEKLPDAGYATVFQAERQQVESYVKKLTPGGDALVILSSRTAGQWHGLWMPVRVGEHVRFGPGAYVLPLIDALDELEPVGIAIVTLRKARVMVLEAGRITAGSLLQGEVSDKKRAGNYAIYSSGRPKSAAARARYERHMATDVEVHLMQAAVTLEALRRERGFQRLFLAGSSEARRRFKGLLPHQLGQALVREVAIDLHATDEAVRSKVADVAQEAEREQELALIRRIMTAAGKQRGAVAGRDETLWALNRHELHLLALAPEMDQPGRWCRACDILLPPDDWKCPQCAAKTLAVDLLEEVPRLALKQGVQMEIVHGSAAAELWHQDGLGGILKLEASGRRRKRA